MRPHIGQGAAMAIEDGVMLARCIAHHKGEDVGRIFALYEGMRRERATRVQASAQTEGWLRHGMGNATITADWLYGYDVSEIPLEGVGVPEKMPA